MIVRILVAAGVTLAFAAPLAGQQSAVGGAAQGPARRLERKLPFEVLPAPADAEGYSTRLGGQETSITVERDVLTVLHRHAGSHVQMTGGIQLPMNRVKDTDIWLLQLKMAGWEKAFFTYFFLGDETPPGGRLTVKPETWYGSQAPARPAVAERLRGTLVNRKLHSQSLGEDRDITVYLPPDAPDHDLPAFFMADGQGCAEFARVLEPLILAQKVRPAAIVGIFSGEYRGDRARGYDPKLDLRNLEYIPHDDPDRYNRHMEFFTREVPEYVARELHISARRGDRAVFGFSNGGAMAAAAAVRHPETFGYSMPFSLGIPPEGPKPEGRLPVFHFAAGRLETFQYSTRETYEKVKAWGAEASLELYTSGHDQAMWKTAFAHFAPLVFPAERTSPAP